MKRKTLLFGLLWFFAVNLLVLAQQNGKLQIHFIDVGQGDAALLISPQGEMVLFDDGAIKYCDKPVAYLHKLGVKKIDYHIASHYHSDHIGCCAQVLNEVHLQKDALDRGGNYNSAIFKSYLVAVGAHRKTADTNTVITLDAGTQHPVTIRVVALNADGIDTSNENDESVDCVVQFDNFRAEIGGDLSGHDTSSYKDIETSVAPRVGVIDVYKVHHHGSSHSTNDKWVATTKPTVAIISCGDGNTYNHPTEECLDALHRGAVRTYWTETGNGVAPELGMDVVGGTIVVEVPPDASTYTVTYKGNHTDTYALHGSTANPSVVNTPGNLVDTYTWSTSYGSKVYHYIHCVYAKPDDPKWRQGANPPEGRTLHTGCPR
jgi:beta-lactamase superfamily II metal-dependent hydrolase